MQYPRMFATSRVNRTHISTNLNDDRAWPVLGADNQVKESQPRENNEETTIVATASRPIGQTECTQPATLEYLEFPELGATVSGIRYDMLSCLPEPVSATYRTMDIGRHRKHHKISAISRRHARLRIDLPLIVRDLMSSRNVTHLQLEPWQSRAERDRINNGIETTKRIGTDVAKLKKPSKLKRIIVLDRKMRIHAKNIAEHHLLAASRDDAISNHINTINMDALKISSETEEADMDFTKQMSVLSFSSRSNHSVESGSSSTSTQLRRDFIDKLTHLNIQKSECTEVTSQVPNTELLRQNLTALGHKMNDCVTFDERRSVGLKIQNQSYQIFEHKQEDASTETHTDQAKDADEPVRWYWPRFRE